MTSSSRTDITVRALRSAARRIREIFAMWLPGFSIHRKKFFVLEEQKIIYVPISKAANSTIKAMLLSAVGFETSSPDDPYHVHRSIEFRRFTKNRLPRDHRKYFMFTVVRSDEDRLRSCYQNKFRDSNKVSRRGFEFGEYLGGYLNLSDSYPEFRQKVERLPNDVRDEHLVEQFYWIYGVHKANPRLYSLERLEDLREDLRTWGLQVGGIGAANRTESAVKGSSTETVSDLMLEVGRA